jgi:hypothetical protein
VVASPDVFQDAYDFYDGQTSEVRPSTAAHNSARFPYVSPAGTREDGTHIVDGGYFENFGATTATELLKEGLDRFGKGLIRPVVILISNDPALKATSLPRTPASKPEQVKGQALAAEALGPIRGFLNTRDARGLLAAAELRAMAEDANGRYFQFRLCSDEAAHRAVPPLGWVMNDDSEKFMRDQLRSKSDTCGNYQQFIALLMALGVTSPPPD